MCRALTGAWDAAIDTSGYQPEPVAASAALDVGHYVFVSTVNVYPGWPRGAGGRGLADAPGRRGRVRAAEGGVRARAGGGAAGPLRHRARRAARAGRTTASSGCPGGWRRIARGGVVPAPGDPERRVQLIDARDLAAFLLDLAEQRVAGRVQRHRADRAGDDARGARGRGGRDRLRRASCAGCPTRRWRAPTPSPGPSCRCGRRPPAGRAPGRSAPRAPRPPACAAARSRRPSPTSPPGCATAARTS